MVATVKTAETSPTQLAELMVGRKVLLDVHKPPAKPGKVVLEARNLKVVDKHGIERLRGIDLDIRAGEILGVAGVSGNGQTELVNVLSGTTQIDSGTIEVEGRQLGSNTPQSLMRAGVGILGEDRHASAVHALQVVENLILIIQQC